MDIYVKEEYISPIVKVIKWYLKTYKIDSMDEEWLKRVCNRFEEGKGNYICVENELYLVKEAFSYAKSAKFQDGITQLGVDNIYSWLEKEFTNRKRP